VASIQRRRLADQLIRVFRLDRLPTGQVLEEDAVHVTYPVPLLDAQQEVASITASLNGVLVTVNDVDAVELAPGGDFGIERLRYWHRIIFHVGIGTVTPITTQLEVRHPDLASGVQLWGGPLVNPGVYYFGPVLVQPGFVLSFGTLQAGGAGDTLDVQLEGWSAPAGGNVPLVPAFEKS